MLTARTLQYVNIGESMNKKTLTPVVVPTVLICRHGKLLQFFFFTKISFFFYRELINFMLEITIN